MAIQLNHDFSTELLKHRQRTKAPTSSGPKRLRIMAASGSGSGSGGAQRLIESGAVRVIAPKEAGPALSGEGFQLLDVRPEWERAKARVKGSLNVPLFVEDRDNSPITLLKKWVHFGYIGLWTGQSFTTFNPDFVQQVEIAAPDKTCKLLVACGEGLRSRMAASKLYASGYKNLGWLVGGFNRAAEEDFPQVEGPEKLKYATIGGASYYLIKLLTLFESIGKGN